MSTTNSLLDHIAVVEGVQSQVRNYYTPRDFFKHDPSTGTVVNRYGQRTLRVPEEFVIGMSTGLEKEVGEQSASEIMYKCGQTWGQKDIKAFQPRLSKEFNCEFSKFGMGMMLESWWWPLQIQGWGSWRYDFTQGKQGLLFVDLYESAVAKSLGNVGGVVCHFYAGLFATVFGHLAKRELSCIEIQCYAMGEDFCKFLIASDDRVNAASFWRNEGASSKEIIKKIKEA